MDDEEIYWQDAIDHMEANIACLRQSLESCQNVLPRMHLMLDDIRNKKSENKTIH